MNIQNEYLQEHELERIEIMREILQNLSDNFVLKGGTALLFGYGLNRFSEDIDLDVINTDRAIKQELTKIKIKNHEVNISVKKDTDTTFRIMIDYGASKHNDLYGDVPYALKVEVSKRFKGIHSDDYKKVNGINIYNVDKIISQKINAFSGRNKARDIYDIHFLLNNYKEEFSLEHYRSLMEIMDRKDIETIAFELAVAQKEGIISGINQSFDPEKMALEIDEAVINGIKEKSQNKDLNTSINLTISKPKEKGGLER